MDTYSAPFSASTISIFLFLFATVILASMETPRVSKVPTAQVSGLTVVFNSYSLASLVTRLGPVIHFFNRHVTDPLLRKIDR